MTNLEIALLLTTLAGMATLIGGLVSVFINPNQKNLGTVLAFSAGVMLYISFLELFPTGIKAFSGSSFPMLFAGLSFLSGVALFYLISKIAPENNTPHHNINKLSWVSVLAVTLHNFPEGMATFSVSMDNMSLALPVFIAISLHNIPEGIIIASPVYFLTGSKMKALGVTLISALAEPIGGLIGYYTFSSIFHQYSMGVSFCLISGLMIALALSQLLPEAYKLTTNRSFVCAIIVGILVMAVSLNI